MLTPQVVFAATAATGSITGIAPGIFAGFDEALTINDGTNSYLFLVTNMGGAFNGLCYPLGGWETYSQPCNTGDSTVIDVGGAGGEETAALVASFAQAINATAINITATENGIVVTLTHDSSGTTGNQTITETVADISFGVSGMSGGTDTEAVPEFTDTLYIAVLAAGGWYVFNRMAQKQKV